MKWIDAILATLGSRRALERLLAKLYRVLDPEIKEEDE